MGHITEEAYLAENARLERPRAGLELTTARAPTIRLDGLLGDLARLAGFYSRTRVLLALPRPAETGGGIAWSCVRFLPVRRPLPRSSA